ncbi:DinB family protein [Aquimarina sp. MAR_2010_214]|uniref:DinB family protein n=1 Tax=Aquimarina sp. MAR_2010_214 TaxID=1250026 RepID=UPI000C7019CB|nr:DinB family protein [Aquimarina sp. MAR_2010_214]PKV50663.1 DinB family protein [Aquimarina sp. MAR_2010_214]
MEIPDIIQQFNHLLERGTELMKNSSENELRFKPLPDKWSKKEILGHLIDSGINNLQRFTEIQFENKPYKIRKYNQNELVNANHYNEANSDEILGFWLAINERIKKIIELQDEYTLAYQIEISEREKSDLKFLIEDYVNHMEHHLDQIVKSHN